MQTSILECGPVHIVPFSPSDSDLVLDLFSDPAVNRYSEQPAIWTSQQAADFVRAALQDEADHGFARWKVLTEEGTFLGWAGFTPLDETSEICLTYCLSRTAYQRHPDLPKKLCQALADWFFENTYFSHLIAVVRTDNRAMRLAVRSAGFYFRESKTINGMPMDVFQMLSPCMQSYVLSA